MCLLTLSDEELRRLRVALPHGVVQRRQALRHAVTHLTEEEVRSGQERSCTDGGSAD